MKNRRKACAAFLSLMTLLPAQAFAQYEADTETGTRRLDFIENQRRLERENMLTEEQQQLVEDTRQMKENLRHPVDPKKASPMAFEGDDLAYNEETGEFIAKGKVHAIQLDMHQFDANDGLVKGNLKTNDIEIPGEAHVLQLTPGQSRVILDGVNMVYNYGTKIGTMGGAKGKVDHQYVTGKRFEFYPDKIIIYDGTATKCGARKPDYHESARKMTIYPHDKIVMEHVGIWLKGACLYTKKKHVIDLNKLDDDGPELPKVGYSKKEGAWISHKIKVPIAKNVDGKVHLYASTKFGGRTWGEVKWDMKRSDFRLEYGQYKDSNDVWYKRKPFFYYKYTSPIGKTNFNYTFNYHLGKWQKKGIDSTQRYYALTLSHPGIPLGSGWFLNPSVTYSITQETYNDSEVRGFSYSLSTVKKFDDRWAAYVTYAYSKNNSRNSLYDYDLDDFSRKGMFGVSYRASEKDRFVVGVAYNMDNGGFKFNKMDYYWFHDLHCSQLIVQYKHYKDEDDSIKFKWEFTPW